LSHNKKASSVLVHEKKGYTMSDKPEFRAVYEDKEPGLFEDDLRWQAQWYDEKSLNPDKYERGGFYATEAEAIEGAKRGKEQADFFRRLAKG
jgi:hypothetical protein